MQKPLFNIVVDIVLKKITIETTKPTSRSSNFIFIIKLPDKEFLKKSSFCLDWNACLGNTPAIAFFSKDFVYLKFISFLSTLYCLFKIVVLILSHLPLSEIG